MDVELITGLFILVFISLIISLYFKLKCIQIIRKSYPEIENIKERLNGSDKERVGDPKLRRLIIQAKWATQLNKISLMFFVVILLIMNINVFL